jgi:DNA-directed RNA polymerase subunit RPC12/RpoP
MVTVVVPNENNYVVPEMTDYQCSNCQKVIHYVGTDLQEHDRLFCLDCLSKMPSRPVPPDDANRIDVPKYLTIIGNMVIRRGDWSIRIQVWEVT